MIVTKARIAVSAYFAIQGSALGLVAVHIPSFEQKTGVSFSTLGLLLMLAGVGGFIAMQVVGWFIDHVGSGTATRYGSLVAGVAVAFFSLVNDPLTLGFAFFFLGVGLSAVDVPVNSHSLQVEEAHGKPIFNQFHAFWSIGGFIGSAVGSAFLALAIPVETGFPIYGFLIALTSWFLGAWLLEDKPNVTHRDKAVGKQSSKENRAVLGLVILIGAMGASGATMEGIANDWSALYLTSVIGAEPAIAAWGLAAFSLGMTAARLSIDVLVAKVGRMPIIRYGSILSALVLVAMMFPSTIEVSIFLWALLGVFLAGVVPQLFALAGRLGNPSHHGRNMSRVVGITYLAALAGPSVIGLLTIFVPLNTAFVFGVLLGVWVASGSLILAKVRT
ncbi:MAG: MFS transporter [Microbacteriaceae bacterium]|nr:MFS transporter [Microbacteriaceae bacterium]MDR9444135.1 MFS transporter [Microbacteriaceae bacterium]